MKALSMNGVKIGTDDVAWYVVGNKTGGELT
jgi:hypothetical protein